MKFQDYSLHPDIKRSLAELGFKRPTDIQFKAIPNVLKGEDVLGIAQTGTGKTAAFAIPILQLIIQGNPDKNVKAVVMVPTHELAVQISEVFKNIGSYLRIKTIGIFGGVDQEPQINALQKGVDIVIATPGRLFDLVSQKHLDLRSVKYLVLDEADQMLDRGFYRDITDLIRLLPKKRQTLFFSATINENIKKLAYSIVNNPIRIQISPKDPVSKNVSHSVMKMAMDDKRYFLERIVKQNPDKRILVFVRTKVRAERVAAAMERVGINSFTMHGGKEQEDRLSVMSKFRSGDIKLLITTDVNARGVDIPSVEYVVNYDLPDIAENYVHRVGRTGRGMQKGTAVSFCSPEEQSLLESIEAFTQYPLNEIKFDKTDYQATLDFSAEIKPDLGALLSEIEDFENFKKKKKGKK